MSDYAGIGARSAPIWALESLTKAARALAVVGHRAHSGGALGSDIAVAAGVAQVPGAEIHIYLPWEGYNDVAGARLVRPKPEAYEIAARFHPFWPNLKQGARHLHARNSHIILGEELDEPVSFVLCYTHDGTLDGQGNHSGGTSQALRIAAEYEIPVYNIGRPEHRERWDELISLVPCDDMATRDHA